MKRAAFFDVDYTLLAGNSMMLYTRYLRQQGQCSLLDLLVGSYYVAKYKLNLLDMEKVMDQLSVQYENMPEAHLREQCERWFSEMVVHYLYPEGIQLIEDHRNAGDQLGLLSATSIYLMLPLSRHLKIENYFCNSMKVENGILTGKMNLPLCYGRDKLEFARRFELEQGIGLKDCFYYSDSITDLETMEAFGFPVAVNPDPLLRREARKRGWKIMDFKVPPPAKTRKR
jgi:HAD superfamily hydrolase (TIGR01490 family)